METTRPPFVAYAIDLAFSIVRLNASTVLMSGYAVWKLRHNLNVGRLVPLIVGSAIGVPFGILVLRWVPPAHLRVAIGIVLILFSLYSLVRPTLPSMKQAGGAIVQFTLPRRIPSIFVFREYVEQGGLMSYAPDRNALSRRTADYVHRIARGAKPSDLPIERPTAFELAINLRTAKALSLEFLPAILLRADEVIE